MLWYWPEIQYMGLSICKISSNHLLNLSIMPPWVVLISQFNGFGILSIFFNLLFSLSYDWEFSLNLEDSLMVK